MTPAARIVQRTYLVLTLLNTLAASFIWGINRQRSLLGGLVPMPSRTTGAAAATGAG